MTCGSGIQTRQRTLLDGPETRNGNSECNGEKPSETKLCNLIRCQSKKNNLKFSKNTQKNKIKYVFSTSIIKNFNVLLNKKE